MTDINLNSWLLELAKLCDKNRFYPFPEAFRLYEKNHNDEKDEKDVSINSNIYLNNNNSDKYKEILKEFNNTFIPYTENEYNYMNNVLKNLTTDPVTDLEKKLYQYIIDLPIRLYYHGNKAIAPDIYEYAFDYDKLSERLLDKKYKSRWYLFHGSKIGNWHSIIRNGIKSMSGTKLMSAGAAAGPGIYCSDDIRVSYMYGLQENNKSCVAVVEFVEDIINYRKGEHYVIPNEVKITVRYLFKIDKAPLYTAVEALDFYKRIKEKELNQNNAIYKIRIAKDIESLNKKYTVLEIKNDIITLIINNVIFTIDIDMYPIKFPIFKLVYKLRISDNNFNSEGYYIDNEWTMMNTLEEKCDEISKLLINNEMTNLEY